MSTEHDSDVDSSLQEVVDDVIDEMVGGYYTNADSALNEMMNEKKMDMVVESIENSCVMTAKSQGTISVGKNDVNSRQFLNLPARSLP